MSDPTLMDYYANSKGRGAKLAMWAVIALLIIITVLLWLRNWSEDRLAETPGLVVVATPTKEVKHIPKVAVPVKQPVKVYKGGKKLKQKLTLPEPVVESAVEEVLASTKVEPAGRHPHTVTTTLNTETGESETYVRTDPLPWFVTSSRGSAGIYVGLKNGVQTARFQAEQELFSVKSVHFGAVASIDQPMAGPAGTDYFVGVGAKFEW
jgi:hypothetical protein